MEKHINFFELEKACAKEGCPLCRIISDRSERYIDNMLFEHITNRTFRKTYRLAGGFCYDHSRNLESFRDGLAVAILGKDILEDRIESFKKRKAWKPKGVCPVCLERNSIEKEYLGFLAQKGKSQNAENENELKQFFTASDGLCAVHYGKLLESFKHVPEWLAEFQNNKFIELYRRSEQFVKLSVFGRENEFRQLSEKDQTVWKELAITLRGGS